MEGPHHVHEIGLRGDERPLPLRQRLEFIEPVDPFLRIDQVTHVLVDGPLAVKKLVFALLQGILDFLEEEVLPAALITRCTGRIDHALEALLWRASVQLVGLLLDAVVGVARERL